MSPLQRLFRLLNPDRKDIFRIYFFAAAGGIINLVLPLGVQAIFTYLSGGMISTSLVILVTLVVFAIVFTGLLQVMQMGLIEGIQQKLFHRAAFEFAVRLPRIKIERLKGSYAPELMNRFFDVINLQKGLSKILLDLSGAILQILFGLILLSFYHPFFIVFGVFLLTMLYAVLQYTGPRGLRASIEESTYKYQVVYWLEEIARTLDTFKLAGQTKFPENKTDALVNGYLKAKSKHFGVLVSQYSFIVVFKAMVAGGLLIIGSYLVLNSQINMGQFVAAEIIIILLLNSVEKLILSTEPLYDVLTSLEKIGAITDMELERESGIMFNPERKKEPMTVDVTELRYGTNHLGEPLIHGLNLNIAAGERVMINGVSGSGKTTLLELIAGLRTEYHGNISYNGIPASSINLNSLRSCIGDSLSDEEIFEGTIAENISLQKPWITHEDILWASTKLGLHDFVVQLENGYETKLKPSGSGLPDHIVKRIKIARSTADRLPLVLWQESMNSLTQTDKTKLIEFMVDRENPWTLIVGSGSMDLAQKCDRVVIIQDGGIHYNGPFDALSKKAPELLTLFY